MSNNEYVKRKMGQEVCGWSGEPLRISAIMDPRTINMIMGILSSKLPSEMREKVVEVINEGVAKPLTLTTVITEALGASHDDEKNVDQSTRLTRFDLGRKCNRTGFVKLSDGQISEIKERVRKNYPGSLVAPQVEKLLDGKEVTMKIVEGDEEDDPPNPEAPPS